MFSLLDWRGPLDESFFVKNPPNLGLAYAERLEPRKQIADASSPVLGVLLTHADHRFALGLFGCRPLANRRHRRLRLQRIETAALVSLDPVHNRRLARTEDLREPPQRHLALQHLRDHPHPEHHRVRRVRRHHQTVGPTRPSTAVLALAPSSLLLHLRLSFQASASGREGGRC
jgi:hypothetical protein